MGVAVLKQYNVFHPISGKLNISCDLHIDYEYVASVKAENLVRSFYVSQNDFNVDYRSYGVRSTCVGDVVSDGQEVFMYMGVGFKKINHKHILHKNIKSLHTDIPDIMVEEKLSDDDIDELVENSY